MYKNDFNKIYPTTAMFPGETFLSSVKKVFEIESKEENFSTDFVQLCPQQLGTLSQTMADSLNQKHPNTVFRLHANVNVTGKHFVFDASSDLNDDSVVYYMDCAKKILKNSFIDNVYSIHAGYHTNSINNQSMIDNAKKIRDKLKIDLIIEGLYPSNKKPQLVATIDEYEYLANNFPFALDLSHLNIVFHKTKKPIDSHWVLDMCNHTNCKEIHISDNNGFDDRHMLMGTGSCSWINDIVFNNKFNALIFSEENYKK